MKTKSINIKQYDLLFDLLDCCRQLVYNNQQDNSTKPQIVYLQNLIKEFDKQS